VHIEAEGVPKNSAKVGGSDIGLDQVDLIVGRAVGLDLEASALLKEGARVGLKDLADSQGRRISQGRGGPLRFCL
jgi:hypothetical protein